MHRSPDQQISSGLMAFANGMRANRIQREAYRQAAFEGRDRDAQSRVIARLQAQVQAERRRNVALEARLIADAISASLRG